MRVFLIIFVLAAVFFGIYAYLNRSSSYVDESKNSKALASFSSIVVNKAGTLNLINNDKNSIEIRGISIDQVNIENHDGVLTITPLADASDAFYLVSVEQFSQVTAKGSAKVISNDHFNLSDLTLIALDQSRIYLSFEGNSLNARVEDRAAMLLSGTVQNQHVIVQGKGKYQSTSLASQMANVTVTGNGEVWVLAVQVLRASVFGHGVLRYGGDPEKVEKEVKDFGSFEKTE